MAKTKNTPSMNDAEVQSPDLPPIPQNGPDEITVDPSQFQEVILGSAVAEPLPFTYERVDC